VRKKKSLQTTMSSNLAKWFVAANPLHIPGEANMVPSHVGLDFGSKIKKDHKIRDSSFSARLYTCSSQSKMSGFISLALILPPS
jgi:hypothetical protein